MARLRPKDLIDLFMHHLAMQTAQGYDFPESSLLICRDRIVKMGPVSKANQIIDDFIDLYDEGLRRPLSFFPFSSHIYAVQRLDKNKPEKKAKTEALRRWYGGYAQPGEYADPYINLCAETANPFAPEFETLALQVYGPMMMSMESQSI